MNTKKYFSVDFYSQGTWTRSPSLGGEYKTWREAAEAIWNYIACRGTSFQDHFRVVAVTEEPVSKEWKFEYYGSFGCGYQWQQSSEPRLIGTENEAITKCVEYTKTSTTGLLYRPVFNRNIGGKITRVAI